MRNTNIFLILAIGVIIAGTIPTFADALDPLKVTLSKDVYNKGDILVVYGNLPIVFEEIPDITIQILFNEQVIDGHVIPEFGTIAVMILVVAIVSIIIVSAKTKLSLVPRY